MQTRRVKAQRAVIFVCGMLTSGLVALSSASGLEDDPVSCVDPWHQLCVSNRSACTDCREYCAGPVFAGQCKEEWSYCEITTCPTGSGTVWNECTGKKKTDA